MHLCTRHIFYKHPLRHIKILASLFGISVVILILIPSIIALLWIFVLFFFFFCRS